MRGPIAYGLRCRISPDSGWMMDAPLESSGTNAQTAAEALLAKIDPGTPGEKGPVVDESTAVALTAALDGLESELTQEADLVAQLLQLPAAGLDRVMRQVVQVAQQREQASAGPQTAPAEPPPPMVRLYGALRLCVATIERELPPAEEGDPLGGQSEVLRPLAMVLAEQAQGAGVELETAEVLLLQAWTGGVQQDEDEDEGHQAADDQTGSSL